MYQEQFKDFDNDLDSPPKRSWHLLPVCLPLGYLLGRQRIWYIIP